MMQIEWFFIAFCRNACWLFFEYLKANNIHYCLDQILYDQLLLQVFAFVRQYHELL